MYPEPRHTRSDVGHSRAGDRSKARVLTSRELVAALATEQRLRVVAAVVLGATTPSLIAEASALSDAEVTVALTRLVRSGVVTAGDDGFTIDAGLFAAAARAEAPVRAETDFGTTDPRTIAVLRAFFLDGQLRSIPAAGRKRTVVLEHLAVNFEPGRRYREDEVNAVLRAFHPDVAALRRYLVDEELLSRADGQYWRSGGWVDVG